MTDTYAHQFSERNIPFGIATSAIHPQPQAVTRLHDWVIFLGDCQSAGLFDDIPALTKDAFSQTTLNTFAALGPSVRRQVRDVLQLIFQGNKNKNNLDTSKLPAGSYETVDKVALHMPFTVCDFVGQ